MVLDEQFQQIAAGVKTALQPYVNQVTGQPSALPTPVSPTQTVTDQAAQPSNVSPWLYVLAVYLAAKIL